MQNITKIADHKASIIERELEAKIDKAVAHLVEQGKDPTKLTDYDLTAIATSIELTDDELKHCGKTHLENMAGIFLGMKMVEIINQNMKILPDELRSCMLAYFEAVDSGELEKFTAGGAV